MINYRITIIINIIYLVLLIYCIQHSNLYILQIERLILKKILLSLLIVSSFNSQAFTELEWTTFINETIKTNDDMTWNYDVEKLKSHQNRISSTDLKSLESIANADDQQLSQGAKYLLATQGELSNKFLFDNYLQDKNVKNGLYYLNLNFMSTNEKSNLWDIIKEKEVSISEELKKEFYECSNFVDYHSRGGKNFTFENYDDFFDQRNVIRNYTNSDLLNLEFEISESIYPITITFYNNKYIVHSKNDDKCLSISDNENYTDMQKIIALYKQYQKNDYLFSSCESYSSNSLLKSRLSYLCVNLK